MESHTRKDIGGKIHEENYKEGIIQKVLHGENFHTK